MVICSGIFTSRKTFLNSFFSPSGVFFFSFNLALLTEAKLLCLISISSTFKALETVSLKSFLSTGLFNLSLLLEISLSVDIENTPVFSCTSSLVSGSIVSTSTVFFFNQAI